MTKTNEINSICFQYFTDYPGNETKRLEMLERGFKIIRNGSKWLELVGQAFETEGNCLKQMENA